MNDPEKRTCPFCAEAIEQKAKICPRCRQWLTWKSLRHPMVSVFVHGVPLFVVWIVLVHALVAGLGTLNPRPYYSEVPDALHVLTSQMNWAKTHDGLRIYLTGVLTNSSPETWKEAEFDCRFFDDRGAMLDADAGRSYMTVLPHGDAAFRVAIDPVAATNQYVSFKIRVGNARNGKGMF